MSAKPEKPGDLLSISSSYWEACALHAGVKLGVFSVLADQTRNGAEIAKSLDGDTRGVETLLHALVAMGLLEKDQAGFSNTEISRRHLDREAPGYIGHIVMHHHFLVDQWHRLDQAVLQGQPTRRPGEGDEELRRQSFLLGMHNLVTQLAPKAAQEIDLSGRKRILDLGGGPGTWAIHFCQHNPGLRATVFDLPTTTPYAEKTIAQHGLSDRISFQAGNFLEDTVERSYDAAWLSQILHSNGPDECDRIISLAAGALEPGGLILIHEFLLDPDMTSPKGPALFSLNMLTGTSAGRSYSRTQVEDMLARAGAKNLRLLPFQAPNGSRILVGDV